MRSPRIGVGVVAALAATLTACDDNPMTGPATRAATAPRLSAAVASTGNGAPSGAHYTLNIIGVAHDKSASFSGGNGSRIFVDLGTRKDDGAATTRINLTPGDFGVLDANGTDGVAAFSLPNPDPDGDGTTSYSVYVRALGKPGGKATMQSCYDDAQTGDTWCAVDIAGGVEPVTVERSKGGVAKFQNVSKDLLYVDVCLAVDATTGACTQSEEQPLFSDALDDYFWQYDNNGLKLAQLRFYEVPTTVLAP
jgi:hypothetical protein